jgi:hypothetical protein
VNLEKQLKQLRKGYVKHPSVKKGYKIIAEILKRMDKEEKDITEDLVKQELF